MALSKSKKCIYTVQVWLVAAVMCAFTPALANSKYAAFVIHADTGDILFDKYSTQKRYPASLTKVMTLYLLFDELEAGNLQLDTKLKTSAYAASMPASDLGLKAGDVITVETAIMSLIVKSANDVAVVVAERISGSEKAFAKKMTAKARSMGMRSTNFRNASGLPNRKQYSTARDLSILAQRVLQDHQGYWPYFQTKSFEWKGKTYRSHNRLVGKFKGANGLKTGYTRMSGYNLATTISRGDNRLIGIVLGGRSTKTRDAHMRKILDQAYRDIKRRPSLISVAYRKPPNPSLKPTALAALGGTWPKEPVTMASIEELVVEEASKKDNSPEETTVPILTLAAAAPKDQVNQLLTKNLTDAERLNIIALAEANNSKTYAEGDIEDRSPAEDSTWGIQTGAYSSKSIAEEKMKLAQTKFAEWIADSEPSISFTKSRNKSYYRVRFNSMTEKQSKQTCAAIIKKGGDCFTVREPRAAF